MTLLPILAVALGSTSILSFLVWLLILALVIWCVFLVLGMLPLPEPAKQIITVILAIIFLIALLGHLGISL